MKRLGLALALVLSVAPGAWAQISSGGIYGKITDESGAVMPGATVTLKGENIRPATTVSGSQGEFRFLSLDPGMYTVTVNLVGFANVSRSVNVSVGVNVDIPFSLKVATVEESITVTAETPVVES